MTNTPTTAQLLTARTSWKPTCYLRWIASLALFPQCSSNISSQPTHIRYGGPNALLRLRTWLARQAAEAVHRCRFNPSITLSVISPHRTTSKDTRDEKEVSAPLITKQEQALEFASLLTHWVVYLRAFPLFLASCVTNVWVSGIHSAALVLMNQTVPDCPFMGTIHRLGGRALDHGTRIS